MIFTQNLLSVQVLRGLSGKATVIYAHSRRTNYIYNESLTILKRTRILIDKSESIVKRYGAFE